jgi:general secretion pathway protein H
MTSRNKPGRNKQRRNKQGRSRAGFTLIEILIVLVILGLALAVVAGAVPNRSSGLALTTQADALAGALREARGRALAQSRPVLFAPLPGGHAWQLDGIVHPLPDGIVVSAPLLRFQPDGSATDGTITLAAPGRVRTLRVDWLTGLVAVTQ